MKYLLGVDFGGGASKATLLRTDGWVVATHSVEYPTSYPESGWAEQNPKDWYVAASRNIRSVLEKSRVDPSDILMVALDVATHTAVLLDENFQVLRPAIYWTDTRSKIQVNELRKEYEDFIYQKTLHSPDTIWTLPQLLWVRQNEPEIWKKTRHILFAKDMVRYWLTGEYGTDEIDAQGSMLLDYETGWWCDGLCSLLGIPVEVLPPIHRSTELAGCVTSAAAVDTGLCQGTPVCFGTTDTVMEVFAAGAVEPGQMTVKLATAGRICVITEKPYPHRDLVNYSHVIPGLWYPGTATKSAAASYRWYRDTFGESYRELDMAAEQIEAGCGGLLFHPYLNGELTPYADPMLRGSFTGIQAGHTKAHFSRAVMEGVAFSLMDCRCTLEELEIPLASKAVIIGGGSSSALWRQIVADTLGLTLQLMENNDSSFGSAMLAGVAEGVFSGFSDAARTCIRLRSETRPKPENTKRYASLYPVYRQIHDALAPVYHLMEKADK